MKSKRAVQTEFEKRRKATASGLAKQYKNTNRCQAFYAGDTMNYSDTLHVYNTSGKKRRVTVEFNKVKPYVNGVKGFMAQNRRKAKFSATEGSEQLKLLYTNYINSLHDYIRENANADQQETQQNGDLLTNGYGATETAVTYGDGFASTDPNGEILIGRLDPANVGWDPYARMPGLLDARWVYYHKDYDVNEALDLFDDSKEEDFEAAGNDDSQEGTLYEQRGGIYTKIKEVSFEYANQQKSQVRVFFYQWYDVEKFYRAENPIRNFEDPNQARFAALQLQSMTEEANEEMDGLFEFNPAADVLTFDARTKGRLQEVFGDNIEIFPFKRKVFYSAVISGKHVFTKFRSISQQGYSIKFKTGDFDEKNKIWTGMVNSMMNPQTYYNKALTELMYIIGTNSKGGVMVEQGAVEDIAKFEASYAKTDAVVEVKPGALTDGKIKPKKEPFQPTGLDQIIAIAGNSLHEAVGVDKTFLGSSENKLETAMLQRQRIRQVTSVLAPYFDSETLYQKEQGRMMLDYMRVYVENNDGALFRVVGQDGKEEFAKISEDKLLPEYGISISEAPTTPEEKQEYANFLINMADKLLAAGDPTAKVIYAIAMKYIPLDHADVQRVTEVLMPQEDNIDPAYVQQLEEQLSIAKNEITQAEVVKATSQAELNMAKVDQTRADTEKKGAETILTMEEAEQKDIETRLAKKAGGSVNVNL